MMNATTCLRSPPVRAALAVGALFLCSCAADTTASRIREKSAVFTSLTPQLQDAVKTGRIAVGFTREMTYMALGKPNLVVSSADGREIAWTYMSYFATPDEEIELQNRHAISSNILGGKDAVFTAGAQVPRGTQNVTLASGGQLGPGDAGTGWQTVMGREDLERGEVTIPDPTVRQKTAIERIATRMEENQDLVLSFQDGILVQMEYVRN